MQILPKSWILTSNLLSNLESEWELRVWMSRRCNTLKIRPNSRIRFSRPQENKRNIKVEAELQNCKTINYKTSDSNTDFRIIRKICDAPSESDPIPKTAKKLTIRLTIEPAVNKSGTPGNHRIWEIHGSLKNYMIPLNHG